MFKLMVGNWFLENVVYTEPGRINCLFFYYIDNVLNPSVPNDIYIITNDSLSTPEKLYYLHLRETLGN